MIKRLALLAAALGLFTVPLTGMASAQPAGPGETSVAAAAPVTAHPPISPAAVSALKGMTPVAPADVAKLLAKTPGSALAPRLRTDGVYDHITNLNSGQCLAVPGGSTAQGTGLIQWPCGTWNDHYWSVQYQFTSSGFYWYHVVNLNSQQCLAVPGGSTTQGTQVIQWPCGTWADHYWAFATDRAGVTHIANGNSGQCLAIPGGSTAQGTKVIQWPCGTWNDHYWY
ncbi:RICIN domain-containing protein [Streptomyces sp. NPDC020719]|uniref:RICIN domain-containing protein n=1 Tax=Streptomyces sp. NPDC020719 TaxID=3154896 RepID=UPI0033D71252